MNETPHAADWDRYWKGTWEAAAHQDGSPQDQALEKFWRRFLDSTAVSPSALLLDVACGNGALVRYLERLRTPAMRFALDYSHSALLNLEQRYRNVHCVAADAFSPPFLPGSFDLLVSQFGIEYAGIEAIPKAAELLGVGGCLGLVMHLQDGVIYRECRANRDALLDLQTLQLPGLARAAFAAGFALNAGRIDPESFKRAERQFTPAVRGLEQLLQQHGRAVAGGLLDRIYQDIAHMYRRMSAHSEEDVLSWIDGLGPEIEAYLGRMHSMMEAALGEPELQHLEERLYALGFRDLERATLNMGTAGNAGAWTLIARR